MLILLDSDQWSLYMDNYVHMTSTLAKFCMYFLTATEFKHAFDSQLIEWLHKSLGYILFH